MTIAEGFLQHGASAVALLDLDEAEGLNAIGRLHSLFTDKKEGIVFRAVDVRDASPLGETIHEIAEAFGKIDILICFAGIVNSTRAIEYTPEGFRKICDANTVGTFLTAQAVGRYVRCFLDNSLTSLNMTNVAHNLKVR